MRNRNSFFSNNAAKFMTINYDALVNAATSGDSSTIDFILNAKKNGCKIDLNGVDHSENALEILLKRRDFENASKLIKSGADTAARTTTRTWVNPDPNNDFGAGYYDIGMNRRDFFHSFKYEKDVINFLKNETQRTLMKIVKI